MLRVAGRKKASSSLSSIFCSKGNINVDTCIDTSSTGVSLYDDLLDPSKADYYREQKNLIAHIEYMTPMEYYQECADRVFDSSVERLQQQRINDTDSIEYLTKSLESGRKFHLPFINYAQSGQEGLHRMMVLGDKFGWKDYAFPVLIVEYADPRKHDIQVAERALRTAIDGALQYRYLPGNLPDDLTSEIQWKLDEHNEYLESDQAPYSARCTIENEKEYVYTLKGFEQDIALSVDRESDIQYRDSDDFEIEDEDLDIDEADIDELLKM